MSGGSGSGSSNMEDSMGSLTCGDDLKRYPTTLLTLSVIYLVGGTVNVVAFAAIIAFTGYRIKGIGSRKGWRSRFMLYQMQLCLCLCLYELSTCLGFLLFPCQFLELSYSNADAFVCGCVALATATLFSLLAAFSWVFVVSLHISRLVAKQCQHDMTRECDEEGEPFFHLDRRMTLADSEDGFAAAAAAAAHAQKNFDRKFSEDLRYDCADARPMYERRMEAEERERRRRARSVWYVKLFGSLRLSCRLAFCFGYLPALILTALSLGTRPSTNIPQDFDPNSGSDWDQLDGIDVFCWPGFETKMIWYELAFVTFTSVGIVYIRVKTLQMVRMMRFGQDKFAVSVQRVARWQRKQHRLQGPGELETDFMIPTFLQTWVLTFNTLLGLLLAFSFWGAVVPFTVVSLLKAVVFFLHLVLYHTEFYHSKWGQHKLRRQWSTTK